MNTFQLMSPRYLRFTKEDSAKYSRLRNEEQQNRRAQRECRDLLQDLACAKGYLLARDEQALPEDHKE